MVQQQLLGSLGMSRKIIKYHTESDDHLERFNQTISHMLKEGWELYGDPCTGSVGDSTDMIFMFVQALVKYSS